MMGLNIFVVETVAMSHTVVVAGLVNVETMTQVILDLCCRAIDATA